MQQSSSLPEQNLQLNATQTLLKAIQQLRAQLWFEQSLNQLQNRLHDYLLSAFTTFPQHTSIEAEIFQTVVDELESALSGSKVVIVIFLPHETVGRICYVSRSSFQSSHRARLEVTLEKGRKLPLRLKEVISLEDIQYLKSQEPPNAYCLQTNLSDSVGWLIIATDPLQSDSKSPRVFPVQLRSQLLTRTAQECTKTLTHLGLLRSCQQRSQDLEYFNQELERTNQLKNEFLANTSHEIRTPLSSIIGFTHLLLAQGYDPRREHHQEYLNIIQSSGKHLLDLINDILDLSKIEANQLEVQWETVNVQGLCGNVLALVKEKAANKGLKLHLEIEANVTTLVADSLRLKQMLLNLLFNALKFTSTGSIGLQVTLKSGFVHFTVWDTGTGITLENQAQLFQPYHQIDNPVADRTQGTGLGLVVTKKLAEIHGGFVEVESEINRGSRFTIVLPLQPMGEVSVDPDAKSTRSNRSLADGAIPLSCSSNILLVENDLPNAKLIRIYLSRLGYQVIWVKTAARMWRVLNRVELPAVILMDVSLPDANGLQLVRELRANLQYQHIPIIVQTAMAMKGDQEICLAAGVDEYISKPIDLPLLARLVAKYGCQDQG